MDAEGQKINEQHAIKRQEKDSIIKQEMIALEISMLNQRSSRVKEDAGVGYDNGGGDRRAEAKADGFIQAGILLSMDQSGSAKQPSTSHEEQSGLRHQLHDVSPAPVEYSEPMIQKELVRYLGMRQTGVQIGKGKPEWDAASEFSFYQ